MPELSVMEECRLQADTCCTFEKCAMWEQCQK